MKNILKEYIELTDDQKEYLWNNCDFVFDTNVLLNLYRYSTKMSKLIIASLHDLKDRIWLPYNIAEEFLKNRQKVIFNKNSDINSLDRLSDNFIKDCCNILRLQPEEKEIKLIQTNLSNWIEDIKYAFILDSSKDKILERLLKLFEGKVGLPYSKEQLMDIKKSAEQRYKNEIPPGYKDANKQNASGDNNMYGDYIIWKQILDYSKSGNRNIIFITQDKKEDWWYRISGKTVGPRAELRKEFNDNTKMEFYMYTLDQFLQIHRKISRNITLEIRSLEWEDKYNVQVGHLFDLNDDFIAWQVEDEVKELIEMKERLQQYDITQLNENSYNEVKELQIKIKDLQNYLEMWGIWLRDTK
ncbi:MAG: DUF4935 domain-containing protein [Clostridiaceae bacterium]|nr:DUF4935 domain-containing protein [Clostridiaceae bacterium]